MKHHPVVAAARRSLFTALASLLLASQLAGCVVVRDGHAPLVHPAAQPLPLSTRLKVFSEWRIAPTRGVAFEAAQDGPVYNEWFQRVVLETGCCTWVNREEEADLIISGQYRPDALPPLAASVTPLLVLASVPVTHVQDVNVRVQVFDRRHQRHTQHEASEQVFTAGWLPFVLLMPWLSPGQDDHLNPMRKLVLSLQQQGLLQPI